MNIFFVIIIAFMLFALAFLGLGLSALFKRRDRPGSCAHDPTEDHATGQTGCDVCGGDEEKCCRNQE